MRIAAVRSGPNAAGQSSRGPHYLSSPSHRCSHARSRSEATSIRPGGLSLSRQRPVERRRPGCGPADGVRRHTARPGAGDRAGPVVRAGLSRARVAQEAAGRDGEGADRYPRDHRRAGDPVGRDGAGRDAARSQARARRLAQGVAEARRAGDRGGTRAQRDWANWAWEDRAAVFLRAAELLTTTWRDTINAATMLGQSKTVYQA